MSRAGRAAVSLHHGRHRFEHLYNATYQDVRAFATRRLTNRSAVDDVVSETFLIAWRRLEQVPADVSEALLWLYRVAQYGVLNTERGERRRTALRDRLRAVANAAVGDDRVIVLDEESEALASAFATLTESDRTILLLAAWEGLTPSRIAVVLDCSPGAAATRLSRARSRFEEAMTDQRTDSERDGDR